MNTAPEPSGDLVPAAPNPPASLRNQLPGIVARAGNAAVFAADEFFFGRIRNEHTRTTGLYDRREDEISLDEIERIAI